MLDPALELLVSYLLEHPQKTLLLIDEQTDVQCLKALSQHPKLDCISQRIDQYQALRHMGISCFLSDYDFNALAAQQYTLIAHRISKQKHIINHILNAVNRLLLSHGQLVLAGAKQEGIKTLAKSLKQSSQHSMRQRSNNQNELHCFTAPRIQQEETTYPHIQAGPHYKGQQFLTKPGVFGWQKIDIGSQLLIQALPKAELENATRLLDLGCGYGFLSVMAHTYNKDLNITATDNNTAAIAACQANFTKKAIKGDAVLSDCGKDISQRFDIVLCNPPFHNGFAVKTDLIGLFLQNAKARLKPHGKAYFVVNQFVGLHTKAKDMFEQCTLLADEDGFHVYELSLIKPH